MALVLTSITGTISRTNDNGFQLQEHPGLWRNISRYADPRPEIPPVGAEVELGVDKDGFVREIRVTSIGDGASSADNGATTRAPASRSDSTAASSTNSGTPTGPIDLQRAALWARCLQAAASYAASLPSGPSEPWSASTIVELADVWFGKALGRGRG